MNQLPYSIGIEIDGNVFYKLVPKNSPLPAKSFQSITTVSDNQFSIELHLLKGNSDCAHKNKSLGRFVLSGLKAQKKSQPKIDLTIHIDSHGLITLKMEDTASEKQLIQTLSVESYDEVFNLDFLSDDLNHRKTRLQRHISHLSQLMTQEHHLLSGSFASEIYENLTLAQEALKREHRQAIIEMPLILETLIAEAEAVKRASL
ncbi:MAG: Hsp70 family protein [Spirochaetales bacterium]|nr:Hsp70 family protein [Spirochaetales bacterium]